MKMLSVMAMLQVPMAKMMVAEFQMLQLQGYWLAELLGLQSLPGSPPSGRR